MLLANQLTEIPVCLYYLIYKLDDEYYGIVSLVEFKQRIQDRLIKYYIIDGFDNLIEVVKNLYDRSKKTQKSLASVMNLVKKFKREKEYLIYKV